MNIFKNTYAWFKRPNKSTFEQYLETFIIILPIAFVIRTFFYGLYHVPTGSMEVTMLIGEKFFADKLTILFRKPRHGDIITFNDPNFDYSENKLKRLYQQYVWGPTNWTKRVIGVPGDTLKGVIEDGKPVVYCNGSKLEEPYINPYPLIALYKESGTCPPCDFRSWDPKVSFEQQPFYIMNPLDVKRAARILRQYNEESVHYPYIPVRNVYGVIKDEFEVILGEDEYWVMGDNRRASNDSRFWGPLKSEFIHGRIIWRLISVDSHDSWLVFDLLMHPIEFWSRVRWSRFFQRVY